MFRIDHAVCNDKWMGDFPCSQVEYINQGLSDHCPWLLSVGFDQDVGGGYHFISITSRCNIRISIT